MYCHIPEDCSLYISGSPHSSFCCYTYRTRLSVSYDLMLEYYY